jgi:hypothetical protein
VDDNGRQDIEHMTSTISRIRINHSSLHPVYLAKLLYSCKVIREFQYTIGGRAMGGHGNPFFHSHTGLQSALRAQEYSRKD